MCRNHSSYIYGCVIELYASFVDQCTGNSGLDRGLSCSCKLHKSNLLLLEKGEPSQKLWYLSTSSVIQLIVAYSKHSLPLVWFHEYSAYASEYKTSQPKP
jgi:hypothetical protein